MKIILTCEEIKQNSFILPTTDIGFIHAAEKLIEDAFPNYDIGLFVGSGSLVCPMDVVFGCYVEFDILPIEDL